MEQEISLFDRPIPGQSLTDTPRNNPWENPAEMSEIEDVTKFYIERLANQEVLDDLAALCQAGLPLKPMVTSIVSSGNMRGMHTVDAGMLVAPIIHQFLKQTIKAMGVEVKDDGIDYQKKVDKSEMDRFQMIALSYLKDNPDDSDAGIQMLQEIIEGTPEEEETSTEENKPKGLMARG